MSLVLDTCALLWYTLDPSELSGAAHRAISSADSLIVSSISLWEVGMKSVRGRLDLGITYEEYVDRVAKSSEIEIVPVDHLLWKESILLDWKHRDPADRVIVAMAKQLRLPIVTDDDVIRNFYRQTI